MIVKQSWMKAGALIAALAIVLLIFGTDRLRDTLNGPHPSHLNQETVPDFVAIEEKLDDFRTAAIIQLIQALAIVVTGLLHTLRPRLTLLIALWSFLLGTCLYCGGQYISLLINVGSFATPATMVGALLLVLGWFAFVEGSCQGRYGHIQENL